MIELLFWLLNCADDDDDDGRRWVPTQRGGWRRWRRWAVDPAHVVLCLYTLFNNSRNDEQLFLSVCLSHFLFHCAPANTEGDKRGDKAPADDKVRKCEDDDDNFERCKILTVILSECFAFNVCVFQSKKLQPGKIGVFSQSHYYLALYHFKAVEKDDLDVQWVPLHTFPDFFQCLSLSF